MSEGYTVGSYYQSPISISNFYATDLGNSSWSITVPGWSGSQVGFYKQFSADISANVTFSTNTSLGGVTVYYYNYSTPPAFNAFGLHWDNINYNVSNNITLSVNIPAGNYFGFKATNNGHPVTITFSNLPHIISPVEQIMLNFYNAKQATNLTEKQRELLYKADALDAGPIQLPNIL